MFYNILPLCCNFLSNKCSLDEHKRLKKKKKQNIVLTQNTWTVVYEYTHTHASHTNLFESMNTNEFDLGQFSSVASMLLARILSIELTANKLHENQVYFSDWMITLLQTSMLMHCLYFGLLGKLFVHMCEVVHISECVWCVVLCWQEHIQANRSAQWLQGDSVKRNWALSPCAWIAGYLDDRMPQRPSQSNRTE